MTFSSLSELSRGMVILVTFITLIVCIYNVIRSLIIRRNKIYTFISIADMLITFVLFEILEMHHVGDWLVKFQMHISLLLLLQISLFVLAVVQQYAIGKWAKEHISNMSVKEAFDKLPTGLCYYYEGGIPVMVNETMHEISRGLFGKGVTDAEELWENLRNCEPADMISEGITGKEIHKNIAGESDGAEDVEAVRDAGESDGVEDVESLRDAGEPYGDRNDIPLQNDVYMVRTEDGKVYSVARNMLHINGKNLPEIIATDVTGEFSLTKELEARQEKAKRLNDRLKALMGTIEYVTMNRELLQLKAALHDNIGQSILIARKYLSEPDSIDREEMLKFWRNNIRHLRGNEIEEWELPYYVISKEADKLGIKLQIIGDLPTEGRLIPVVDAAISVHIGNTLKHAYGSECIISVKKTAGSYILNFVNDGKKPDDVIIEKGGLKNLRRDVENVGGTMNIYTSPEFRMEIILPGEDI
ncbi:hypothetical protein [Butyrivibrio sp. VCD2006]|uniref:hypothetical protein n=1 Tax=Butyrivibrio sp. VCD2006 TaxID=1280664 RepID=UPI0003FC3907|nr:hypothetical protein [Butyrivibrio sp. VCD2006]